MNKRQHYGHEPLADLARIAKGGTKDGSCDNRNYGNSGKRGIGHRLLDTDLEEGILKKELDHQ